MLGVMLPKRSRTFATLRPTCRCCYARRTLSERDPATNTAETVVYIGAGRTLPDEHERPKREITKLAAAVPLAG
jgi:hypothetical protein